MKTTHRLRRTVAAGLFGAALTACAQNLPEGTGKATFQRTCSACHSVNVATSQRMTRAEWNEVVNDMVSRGAQGTSGEFESIVNYLSTNFGKGEPAPAAGKKRATPSEQMAPLSGAEVAAAKKLVESNGCLSCHRIAEAGSYIGPNLNDVGSHLSAEQIRHVLTVPNEMLQPDNRTVELVTGDGHRITGRILNQDAFSVQLIDASGELKAVDRQSVREFAIETKNPMPSYANKLSGGDLKIVVRYLASLREPGV